MHDECNNIEILIEKSIGPSMCLTLVHASPKILNQVHATFSSDAMVHHRHLGLVPIVFSFHFHY